MPKGLTASRIKNLKATPVRREIADTCPGLYLIQQPSGHTSYAVRYRFNGRPKKLTLGDAATMSLEDARIGAAKARAEVKGGTDPNNSKKRAKIEAREAAENTFAAITNAYFEQRRVKELRSSARVKHNLERLVFAEIGHRPIGEIKRSEIARLTDKIDTKHGPKMADQVLGNIRVVMKWWLPRADDSFVIPIVPGLRERSNKPRERVLTDGELRAIWLTAEQQSDSFAGLIRVLLLTGARLNEVARMTRSEISGDLWCLPAARHKLKSDLVRPLSAAALVIINQQPQIGDCPYVFSASGRAPLGSFSDRKLKFEKASNTSGWTLHDLRRTARTLLSKAQVNREVAERCLGHLRKNIETTYDRHDYIPEMRVAFKALAARIDSIAHPPIDNIVPIRQ
jgi:integrase